MAQGLPMSETCDLRFFESRQTLSIALLEAERELERSQDALQVQNGTQERSRYAHARSRYLAFENLLPFVFSKRFVTIA